MSTPRKGFVGITPDKMQRLAKVVHVHGQSLYEAGGQVQQVLNSVGLNSSAGKTIGRIGDEMMRKSPDLQRRYRLAISMDNEGNPFSGMSGIARGLTAIRESDLGHVRQFEDGEKAADLSRKAASGDPAAVRRLKKYMGSADDSYFAAAMLRRMKAAGVVGIPAYVSMWLKKSRQADPKSADGTAREGRSILNFFNHCLATATQPSSPNYIGDEYLGDLKKAGRGTHRLPTGQSYSGYWGLGQILRSSDYSPPYSPHFMKTVGRDMIDWDKELQKSRQGAHPNLWPQDLGPFPGDDVESAPGAQHSSALPPGSHGLTTSTPASWADPLTGLMNAAATSREAAQALLNDGFGAKPTTINYLMKERWRQWSMSDRGVALGQAIRAAAKGNDETSNRLTALIAQARADVVKKCTKTDNNRLNITDAERLDALSGLRNDLSIILGNHIDDVNWYLIQPISRPALGEEVLQNGNRRAKFAASDLDYIFSDIGRDETAYRTLMVAESAHLRGAVDRAIKKGGDVSAEIKMGASVLGHMSTAYEQAMIAGGRKNDEAAKKSNQSFKAVVDFGIGLIPVPGAEAIGKASNGVVKSAYEALAKKEYGDFGNVIAGSSDGKELSNAFGKAAGEEGSVDALIKEMIESSAVENGSYRPRDLQHEQDAYSRDHPHGLKYSWTYKKDGHVRIKPWSQLSTDERTAARDWWEHRLRLPRGNGETDGVTAVKGWGEQGMQSGSRDFYRNMGIAANIPGGG